jgi:hypothetical protein
MWRIVDGRTRPWKTSSFTSPSASPPSAGLRLVAVARIIYGYPGPEMIQDVESGRITLGGCCVSDFDPAWQCLECEASIYPEKLKGQMPPDLGAF